MGANTVSQNSPARAKRKTGRLVILVDLTRQLNKLVFGGGGGGVKQSSL